MIFELLTSSFTASVPDFSVSNKTKSKLATSPIVDEKFTVIRLIEF